MLDDCGNVNAGITGGGATVGAAYDFGGGYTAAFGYQTSEVGIATKESNDAYGLNLAYTGDTYGASLTYGSFETGTNGVRTDDYIALNNAAEEDESLVAPESIDFKRSIALYDRVINNFPNSEKDVLLSAGEQISCALIAGKLNAMGYTSRSWMAWQIPILTDGAHSSSRIINIKKKKL